MKPKIPSEYSQKLVASILTRFMFCNDFQSFLHEWDIIFDEFNLYSDPFTSCPCSSGNYFKSLAEYERQTFFDRFGYYEEL